MKNKALDENVTALCFLKAESFTSATSSSTLAKCSQVRGTIRGQALNLKNASTLTGLQSRTCIRNSSL